MRGGLAGFQEKGFSLMSGKRCPAATALLAGVALFALPGLPARAEDPAVNQLMERLERLEKQNEQLEKTLKVQQDQLQRQQELLQRKQSAPPAGAGAAADPAPAKDGGGKDSTRPALSEAAVKKMVDNYLKDQD